MELLPTKSFSRRTTICCSLSELVESVAGENKCRKDSCRERGEEVLSHQSRHDSVMTGATMTATRAGKVKEGRDPSPSLKPASSGSSDEVEPWDERPSNTTTRDDQEPPP